MKLLDLLRQTKEYLEKNGIDSPAREAEEIIAHCMGEERTVLYRDNPEVKGDVLDSIRTLSGRRARREPLQYLIGYVDFCGLKIKVGRGVLIPRPETEILVEEAKTLLDRNAVNERNSLPLPPAEKREGWRGDILDLCTGSGCIALALAAAFPQARVCGTDTSAVALEYAQANAALNNISNAEFLRGNLFEPLGKDTLFDLIISNPPYINHDFLQDLQPEIRIWEPPEALDGGEDGLDYYRAIFAHAHSHLKKRGFIMCELGTGQSEEVRRIAEQGGLTEISLKKDFAGIKRILIGKSGIA